MTDKQFQHLRRAELLQLLLEIEEENELLAAENRSLRDKLNSRELRLSEIGSMAEGAMQISGVFDAAQKAADLYLENVRRACAEREDACAQHCRELAHQTAELCRQVMPGTAEELRTKVEELLKQETAERKHD